MTRENVVRRLPSPIDVSPPRVYPMRTRVPDWPGRCGRLEHYLEQLVGIAERAELTDRERALVERARTLLHAEP